MLKRFSFLFALLLTISALFYVQGHMKPKSKSVLLTVLARNKSHVLPKFLKCIDELEYDKSAITVYINTNNNEDDTENLLESWREKNKSLYKDIIFENHHVESLSQTTPHQWTPERFSVLGKIRNQSLQKAQELKTDYYFVVDCDNFITPCTLQTLIEKDKPIIAPMLKSVPLPNDPYSNFFADISENGYYKDHPEYWQILNRSKVGTFKVPVAHCTYLIKTEYIDRLTYDDGTHDYEFVIFSRVARKNGVDQYICNEKEFGTLVHLVGEPTLEQEKQAIAHLVK
jgi:hypothetical protein